MVQFVPFASFIDPSFWSDLTDRKLHSWKLDDSPKLCVAGYVNHDPPGLPCRLSFDYQSLDESAQIPHSMGKLIGSVLLTNTVEEFKKMDRKAIAEKIGQEIWQEIVEKFWLQDASVLGRFVFTSFADLKRYRYFYWLCCPAICYPKDLRLLSEPQKLGNDSNMARKNSQYYDQSDANKYAFVLRNDDQFGPLTLLADNSICLDTLTLVFSDPSTLEWNPGWPLRNILAAIAYSRPECNRLKVLCFRRRFNGGQMDLSQSLLLHIGWQPSSVPNECPKIVGWEKNDQDKLEPRFVDMSASMDPVRIAENAVDLNLQLMRWRLLPDIQLEKMKNLRCLLFGSGTIGCNLARCLMGWGVRHLTLVDSGRISASNPVRQSLFAFSDSANGGRFKCDVAVEELRRIHPAIHAKGVRMTVPMPGHPVSANDEESVRSTISELEKLVDDHDAVFLLLDTREGRWLPTLLASIKRKIAISVALGFDTYVIIRHGVDLAPNLSAMKEVPASMIPGNQLGCYFCSDVTAPGNSSRDRSLDQQCTVSRPGLSQVASGMAVELLASLIQHPLREHAPALLGAIDFDSSDDNASCLGSTPHQIRGYVSRFNQLTPCVRRFERCIACGDSVKNEYIKRGFSFLKDVLDTPENLEEVAGLTELHQSTKDIDLWEFSDNESVASMEA